MSLKTGGRVAITFNGRTVHGTITLASPNERSLMLEFAAILDGYVGMMPVLMDDEGVYRDLLTGRVVTVKNL